MTYDPNRPTTSGATQREFDQTAEKAHDTIDRTTDAAHSAVDSVADKAQQVGAQAVDKVDAATTDVGAKMTEAAQTIREKAPMSGPVADAASTAATTLERAGTYLQQQDLADMRADLEGIIRRHPIESLLIGLGIGYLLARSTRR
jgi:hypothetical protein